MLFITPSFREKGASAIWGKVEWRLEVGEVYWGRILEWFEGQAVARVSSTKGPE